MVIFLYFFFLFSLFFYFLAISFLFLLRYNGTLLDAETLCDGSFEDHYTFKPEISKRSQNIQNVKSFDERLYEDQKRRIIKQQHNVKLKQQLLTFTPATKNSSKKWKPQHYHASVSVQVPTNHFGLPGSVVQQKAKHGTSSSSSSSSSMSDIYWYCKRKPVRFCFFLFFLYFLFMLFLLLIPHMGLSFLLYI